MKTKRFTKRMYIVSLVTNAALACIVYNANAQMQGPHYGLSTIVKAGHTISWKNTSRICRADSQYASVALTPGEISDTIEVGNFHFDVPENAQIQGITVTIGKKANAKGVTDNMVKLICNGKICRANHADTNKWLSNAKQFVYGGEADQWGMDLTSAGVDSYSFGVAISVCNSVSVSNEADIDYVNVCVKYKIADNKIATNHTLNNKRLKETL